MEQMIVRQDYDRLYTAEDHTTWSILSERQERLRKRNVSRQYLDGFEKLQLEGDKVINIEQVSRRLAAISGWTLIPVTGLIPTRDFFYMLINKQYPVNIYMRKPWEIDFSEQPDIFHDVFGHLPLLTNEKFVKFLTAYSIIALKYVNNDRAIDYLGRLYWYTYEMGIIFEEGEYKPYGGAIITSAEETANARNDQVPKHHFDLAHIFRTPYNPYKLQNEYFIISSFDDLFSSIEKLEETLIENLLLPEQDFTLHNYSLNANLDKGYNNVIGFLNDTQFRFPKAVSFVAGQPDENYFNVGDRIGKLAVYVNHIASKTNEPKETVMNRIGQYAKTKGMINEVIAEYLRKDENILVKPENILLTVGAQEAFSIIVSAICNRGSDVIMVEDPSYIGVSSFAKIFGYQIKGIPANEEGIDLQQLKSSLIELYRAGKNIKLLYVIPDFQNPTGACMPIGNRLKLLELAQKYNFLIIEDSVYNSFTYAQKNPTLKSLDRNNRVIYVGSFSKALFPGLRTGWIVADQQVENNKGEVISLIDEMAKVKAIITNNTSSISQAIVAGTLIDLGYSLQECSKPMFASYKKKRDTMIAALNKYIKVYRNGWAQNITWNEPDGGFFIKMNLPFAVDMQDVVSCAKTHQVIICPMRFFYLENGGENEIRLTFSNLSPEQIEAGVKQLAAYLQSRVAVYETVEAPLAEAAFQ
jgi:monomeric phenylalanine-4-hydroxylase